MVKYIKTESQTSTAAELAGNMGERSRGNNLSNIRKDARRAKTICSHIFETKRGKKFIHTEAMLAVLSTLEGQGSTMRKAKTAYRRAAQKLFYSDRRAKKTLTPSEYEEYQTHLNNKNISTSLAAFEKTSRDNNMRVAVEFVVRKAHADTAHNDISDEEFAMVAFNLANAVNGKPKMRLATRLMCASRASEELQTESDDPSYAKDIVAVVNAVRCPKNRSALARQVAITLWPQVPLTSITESVANALESLALRVRGTSDANTLSTLVGTNGVHTLLHTANLASSVPTASRVAIANCIRMYMK